MAVSLAQVGHPRVCRPCMHAEALTVRHAAECLARVAITTPGVKCVVKCCRSWQLSSAMADPLHCLLQRP